MTKKIGLAVLIDDEEIDQRFYKRAIQKSGLVENVLAFELATEALAYLKAHREIDVDLIFLDINMPTMDGFQFLDTASQELGPNFAKAVVAMLTTSLNPADEVRARSYEIVRAFITKPLTVESVVDVVALVDDA